MNGKQAKLARKLATIPLVQSDIDPRRIPYRKYVDQPKQKFVTVLGSDGVMTKGVVIRITKVLTDSCLRKLEKRSKKRALKSMDQGMH